MPFVKTPTPSLTATKFLTNKLWYRCIARVKRWLHEGVPVASISQSSPIARLPQELVDAIIYCFIYDIHTLLACSVTCRSWYIAAVPHLHHTLTTNDTRDEKFRWPAPLQKSYDLGLLPLVKRFHIRLQFSGPTFTPDRFHGHTLRYFSALTNVQTLGIDNLSICEFIPNFQQYFGHLAPTVRSLALGDPVGSPRQILYFIGLFPNLQDLKLVFGSTVKEQESMVDAGLIPLSVPPLQGRLTLMQSGESLVKDMITLFVPRFRSMDLSRVKGMRLLLDACAETLETLRLYPTDQYVHCSSRRHLNLSPVESIRTLEVAAESITYEGDSASGLLNDALATVSFPHPLDTLITNRWPEHVFHVWWWKKPTFVECALCCDEPRVMQSHPGCLGICMKCGSFDLYSVQTFLITW